MVTRASDRPVRKAVTAVRVLAVGEGTVLSRPDRLATEEPLEIRAHGPGEDPAPVAVTMRTPGHDFELAVGFLLTEGVLASPGDVASVAYCLDGEQQYNVVTVSLRRPVAEAIRPRHFIASSSCGVCGKAALDEVEVRCDRVAPGPRVAAGVLATLPERLAADQPVFDATGGLHAAGRFHADGRLVARREDVGRHNALDKLIGQALLEGALPLADQIVLVSGRVGFELVQKAAVAGIPVICAVSAPSSLAVAAAERFGQTIVGFLRGGHFNVYAHAERVDPAA